jgi:hypothetical protein
MVWIADPVAFLLLPSASLQVLLSSQAESSVPQFRSERTVKIRDVFNLTNDRKYISEKLLQAFDLHLHQECWPTKTAICGRTLQVFCVPVTTPRRLDETEVIKMSGTEQSCADTIENCRSNK